MLAQIPAQGSALGLVPMLELGHLSSRNEGRVSSHWEYTSWYPSDNLLIPAQDLSLELPLLLPHMQSCCVSHVTSGLSVLQMVRNIGNSGFNGIMEANIPSFSLKPTEHSDM